MLPPPSRFFTQAYRKDTTVIGVVILIGFGIMIAVAHSGTKENIEIDRK
jgi:hypothetical protein